MITTTSEKYATSFGFTESEVFTALDEAGMSDQCDVVKKWYDGFVFGGKKGYIQSMVNYEFCLIKEKLIFIGLIPVLTA